MKEDRLEMGTTAPKMKRQQISHEEKSKWELLNNQLPGFSTTADYLMAIVSKRKI